MPERALCAQKLTTTLKEPWVEVLHPTRDLAARGHQPFIVTRPSHRLVISFLRRRWFVLRKRSISAAAWRNSFAAFGLSSSSSVFATRRRRTTMSLSPSRGMLVCCGKC